MKILLICLTILFISIIIFNKIIKYLACQTENIRRTGRREQVTIDNVPYSQKGIWKND